ncbi:hypothetical protein Tco_1140666 [Tanacetum coccineum]
MPKSFNVINPSNYNIPNLIVSITHNLCYMIISEFDSPQEFADEVGELRAISGHMLGAAGVQIPEDNLNDLHASREEDGTSEFMDPQDLLGSFLLQIQIKES